MELSHTLRIESFRALPFAGRRKCRKLAGFAGRCLLRSSRPRLWRYPLQIRPAPRVAVEDMVAAVMGVAGSMAVVAVSTAEAPVSEDFTVEGSTAEDFTAEDFTAADFMVEDFTAALFMAEDFMAADFMATPHMPFAPLRGQDAATAHVTFKPTLKSDLPALAPRIFLEVPSQAATAPQAGRLRATPAR
jgi:hypothetical protein